MRPGLWLDLVRAVIELAIARRHLGLRTARDLVSQPDPKRGQIAIAGVQRRIDRVAWAIPRMAARVPWRSDCLVQAIAARRWLAVQGIATDLWIGTRTSDAAGFQAHAWLCHGAVVVTGGDIAGYVPLLCPAGT